MLLKTAVAPAQAKLHDRTCDCQEIDRQIFRHFVEKTSMDIRCYDDRPSYMRDRYRRPAPNCRVLGWQTGFGQGGSDDAATRQSERGRQSFKLAISARGDLAWFRFFRPR